MTCYPLWNCCVPVKPDLAFKCHMLQSYQTSKHLPNDIHDMYKTLPSKLKYPTVITNILQESQSYIITTLDRATYRHARLCLKLYKP